VTSPTKDKYPPAGLEYMLRRLAWVISKGLWFIHYRGLENIPQRDFGPFILASNHQTYFDPAWICAPLKNRFRFMAFDRAFRWRFIGPLIGYFGAFPVSTELGGTINAMKQAFKTLRDGAALVVFPEGARAFADGELLPFKEGVVRIAAQANVPILPVTISGGNRIWPREQKYPRLFRRVTVTYHPLLTMICDDSDDAHQAFGEYNRILNEIIASEL
jgi:1-acyl-sn-glycerol-3-phosphate acyltransferase